MNSMNDKIKKIEELIENSFEITDKKYPIKQQFSFQVDKEHLHKVLSFLKGNGWKQLTILTCIDWIDINKFELVFILMNWEQGITLIVRTLLNRDDPKFTTVTPIYPGAQYYERDVHEFFGVEFQGNEDSYKHLFLEEWDDMPPLRKDFDTRAYSYKKFGVRDNDYKFEYEGGENK